MGSIAVDFGRLFSRLPQIVSAFITKLTSHSVAASTAWTNHLEFVTAFVAELGAFAILRLTC